jgi:hypothetical protein
MMDAAAKVSREFNNTARELLEKEFGIAPPEKWTLGSFAEYKGLSVDVLKDYEWEETPRGLRCRISAWTVR